MCYSAQVYADWKKFTRMFGARMSVGEFYRTFWTRTQDLEDSGDDEATAEAQEEQAASSERPAKAKKAAPSIIVPKALELAFAHPTTEQEREIKALIDAHTAHEASAFETRMFEQKTRLTKAEREIAERDASGRKVTKQLLNEVRVANNKIGQAKRWLADLHRTELEAADSRIFPGSYCPVMVVENGELVVMPMRYQCRPATHPAFYDVKFPGTYNARRDNLEGHMWGKVFGYSHGLVIASNFFEHVNRHKYEQRDLRPGEKEEDMVIEFQPDGMDEMFVACLWSRWKAPGQPDLLSFAAVTDLPPPEVALAGHDRCIIPLKLENIDAWLRPDPKNLAAQYAILDDRERPFYEHRLAKAA